MQFKFIRTFILIVVLASFNSMLLANLIFALLLYLIAAEITLPHSPVESMKTSDRSNILYCHIVVGGRNEVV